MHLLPALRILLSCAAMLLAAGSTHAAVDDISDDPEVLALLPRIVQGAPSGVGVERYHVIQAVNAYITHMLGYSRDELLGRNIRMLYPSDEAFERVVRSKYEMQPDGDRVPLETQWRRRDGSLVDVTLIATPLRPDDLSAGVVFAVFDISDRKQAEAHLAQRTRAFMAALSTFIVILLVLVMWLSFTLGQRRRVVDALRRENAERRAAERALQDSEGKLRTLIENFPGTVFRCLNDDHWTALFMSSKDGHHAGYPTADFIDNAARSMASLVHPADHARIAAVMQQAAAGNGRWELEYRILHRDGGIRWVVEYGTTVRDGLGRPAYLDGFILDITAQKEASMEVERQVQAFSVLNDIASRSALTLAEQLAIALRLGADFLSLEMAVVCRIEAQRCRVTAIHAPPDGALDIGTELGLATSYCDLAVSAGGLLAVEAMGASPFRDHPCYRALGLESYIGTRLEVGGELHGCLGLAAHTARTTPFSAGEKYFVELLARWISAAIERDQAAQRVRRLAYMVRHSNDAMFLVRDGRIIDCNDAALAMFGRPREGITGSTPEALSPPLQGDGSPSAQRSAAYLAAALHGQPQRFEWLHCRGDGAPFDAEVALSSFEENGEQMVIAVTRDISVRKQREREVLELNATLEARVAERTCELESALDNLRRTQGELLHSEKLASLGALVAGVAHELNTPIGNAVTVSTTLLDEQRRFKERTAAGLTRSAFEDFLASVNEAGSIIERNLARAAELIGSFKQLAVDQTSYQRRAFDLREVVQEITLAMKPTIRRTPFRLVDEVPEGFRLDSYPGPLGQVLMNLINNALIHAFEGRDHGTITLSAELAAEDWLAVSVSDDGCGVPAENLKRIFDPFFTTRLGKGGSGLGLHITYTLVSDLLGGRIEVHSTPGAGARFTVHLPLRAPLRAQA